MGKRAAEVELFVGNMSSIQREDTAFYAKRRTASHDDRSRNGCRTPQVQRRTLYKKLERWGLLREGHTGVPKTHPLVTDGDN